MEPDIFRASTVINIIIAKLHALVLIFYILCVLFRKHTFIAFENVSAECIHGLVFHESIDTYGLDTSKTFYVCLADTLLSIFLE